VGPSAVKIDDIGRSVTRLEKNVLLGSSFDGCFLIAAKPPADDPKLNKENKQTAIIPVNSDLTVWTFIYQVSLISNNLLITV